MVLSPRPASVGRDAVLDYCAMEFGSMHAMCPRSGTVAGNHHREQIRRSQTREVIPLHSIKGGLSFRHSPSQHFLTHLTVCQKCVRTH